MWDVAQMWPRWRCGPDVAQMAMWPRSIPQIYSSQIYSFPPRCIPFWYQELPACQLVSKVTGTYLTFAQNSKIVRGFVHVSFYSPCRIPPTQATGIDWLVLTHTSRHNSALTSELRLRAPCTGPGQRASESLARPVRLSDANELDSDCLVSGVAE